MSSEPAAAAGTGDAFSVSAWCSQKRIVWATPSSVRAKSLAVSPGMNFPCLSLTTTVSTTSCDLTETVYGESLEVLFCPICCAVASAVVVRRSRGVRRLISEPQAQLSFQAAHRVGVKRETELRAVHGRVPPGKNRVIQHVGC